VHCIQQVHIWTTCTYNPASTLKQHPASIHVHLFYVSIQSSKNIGISRLQFKNHRHDHAHTTYDAIERCRHLQLFPWPHQSYQSYYWYGIPWTSPLHLLLGPYFSASVFKCLMKLAFIWRQINKTNIYFFDKLLCTVSVVQHLHIQVWNVAARTCLLMVPDLSTVQPVLCSSFL
jgi:hypothetical protein